MRERRANVWAIEVNALSERIWPLVAPLLSGRDPVVQGAVLADLAAVWLAGHIVVGDGARTDAMRRELLEAHCKAVWELVEHYDAQREQRW